MRVRTTPRFRATFRHIFPLTFPLTIFTVMVAGGCASTAPPTPAVKATIGPMPTDTDPETAALTEKQLQMLLMAFADEYISRIAVQSMRLETNVEGPDLRYVVQVAKHGMMTAAVGIAMGPNPDVALLDMLVLTTLSRDAFERFWMPKLGDVGKPMQEELRAVEAEIWEEALRVLTPDQEATLRSLIDEWLVENPNVPIPYLVRFRAFASLHIEDAGDTTGGRLAAVANATQAVDDIRMLGERSLWYSTRLPIIAGNQAEMTLYDIIRQPEVMQLIDDYHRMSNTVDKLPSLVATARAEAIDHLMDRVTQERKAILDDLDAREGVLRQLMEELRQTVTTGTDLVQASEQTIRAMDTVLARFDEVEDAPDREPLDMKDVRDAAIETRLAAVQLTELLDTTNELLASNEWDDRLVQFETALRHIEQGGNRWINLSTRDAVIVIAVFFVGLLIYKWIAVRVIGAART